MEKLFNNKEKQVWNLQNSNFATMETQDVTNFESYQAHHPLKNIHEKFVEARTCSYAHIY